MALPFEPGDDLIFQLESGYGLLRVLAKDFDGTDTIWHILAYEEFFPDTESAEKSLVSGTLHIRRPHLALTDRAFERTPAAKLGNRAVTEDELVALESWRQSSSRHVHDRSALLLLGLR